MVLVGSMALAGAAAAQPVSFSVDVTPEGARLRARGAAGVAVDKHVSPQGLRIAVSVPGDAVTVVAAPDGSVTVQRGGRAITVQADSVLADHRERVHALTEGSAALAALDDLVVALRHDTRPEATSLLATFALVRALHGDETGNALLAQHQQRRPRRDPSVGIRPAAAQTRLGDTVSDCWDEYERALSRNHDRYNRCLSDYWWNQPVQYACGLEFAMVAELALFRLISCAGGFPLG